MLFFQIGGRDKSAMFSFLKACSLKLWKRHRTDKERGREIIIEEEERVRKKRRKTLIIIESG